MTVKNRVLLPLLLIVALLLGSFAAAPVMADETITVELDGKEIIYNSHTGFPFLDSANRTQVPLRKTMESYGTSVSWDNATQTATLKLATTTVQVMLGRSYIVVNGQNVTMDTEPLLINDRTYLPIRAVAEAFGATVNWQDVTNTVEISKPVDPDKPVVGDTETVFGKERTITFFDDFDGFSLDTSKWLPAPKWPRGDVGGFWSDNMIRLDGNGNLVLSVQKHIDGERYESGAIRSKGRFEQAYGVFEIRCQLQQPSETGFWAAFWLMNDGTYQVGNGARDGVEIDIFESPFPKTDTINQALHWDGYGAEHQTLGNKPQIPGIYEGFHTFTLEWEKDVYRFYVDGELTWETNGGSGGICEVPLYMKITTEVGTWAGSIVEDELPASILVDYVKVYQ